MDRRTEFARIVLNFIVAGSFAGCAAPERNGLKIPPSQPMPERPQLVITGIRCFAPGLSHVIAVDPEGNQYIVDAKKDESCLTLTPQATATPIP